MSFSFDEKRIRELAEAGSIRDEDLIQILLGILVGTSQQELHLEGRFRTYEIDLTNDERVQLLVSIIQTLYGKPIRQALFGRQSVVSNMPPDLEDLLSGHADRYRYRELPKGR